MFRASSCPSSGATTTAVAASGLPSERGDSSAVGRGRGVPGLSWGKERPGRDAYPSPPSSAVGHERVELYLYSPDGPYSLYRASVPVQG
jgi:hypothetical protein